MPYLASFFDAISGVKNWQTSSTQSLVQLMRRGLPGGQPGGLRRQGVFKLFLGVLITLAKNFPSTSQRTHRLKVRLPKLGKWLRAWSLSSFCHQKTMPNVASCNLGIDQWSFDGISDIVFWRHIWRQKADTNYATHHLPNFGMQVFNLSLHVGFVKRAHQLNDLVGHGFSEASWINTAEALYMWNSKYRQLVAALSSFL